jgi:FKBP-type peptidyl-prolyl cis-trans isomerase SlpA
MKRITPDCTVTLYHQIGFTDGSLLEDTFDQQPMTFRLGTGELAKGLEMSLLDLEEGAEQTLDISPELAFGYPEEAMIQSLPRSDFAEDFPIESGLIIEFSTPNGETLPGTILEFDDEQVKVDFNHPLAGHTVRYRIKIVEIEDQSETTLN